jgi:predicted amidohydrolase
VGDGPRRPRGRAWGKIAGFGALGLTVLVLVTMTPVGKSDFPGREELFPDADEWVNDGDSVIVAPGGKLIAGPMRREKGLLFADIDRAAVAPARRVLDVTGHYARADVFQLHVHRAPMPPVVES